MSLDITQETEWDTLISGKKLLAADFWAPWCPFCIRLKPLFESIASKYPDIQFVKLMWKNNRDWQQDMVYEAYL